MDNVVANAGSGGATFATDDVLGVHYPRAKVVWGADGTANDASAANPLPVVQTGALPAGTNNIGDVDVLSIAAGDNNIGNVDIVTVPAPLSTSGGGLEATALRVTVASDSTGVLSVDDNGGSLTVDGTVTANLAAGTNNIGDVDVLTQPARAATTDTITAKLATDTIQNGTTALTPKFAFANVAASTTDGSIVAAVASKKIRVLDYKIMAGGTATNVTFNSKPAGAGTAISMLHACAANGGIAPGFSPIGHFETTAGEGLTVTTGAGSTVGVQVVYVEV